MEQDKREKVIKGLECCTTPGNCGTCPWYPREDAKEGCIRTLMKAMLELLKAQEPIEPTKPDEDNMVYCGACGTPVGYEVLEPPGMDYIRYNYCPDCGQAVKWE